VVSHASHIIAVSENIRTALINELGANHDKISVIPSGVDTKKFKPRSKKISRIRLGLNINSRIALNIGRINKAKGVDLIREAAKELKDVEFYLIGDGPMHWEASNCNFIGVLDPTKIPEWINAADVLLLPSQSEGTPLVILEALASETPIICSRVGACPELIEDRITGLLLPSRNAKSLISAIKSALYKITFDMKIGREMVTSNYSLEQIASRIYKLYCKVFQEYKQRTSPEFFI
jgi:glycosyltransferase involved in cell wall biosynthesis